LLVSDPTAEKAAAACDVRVGSLSDPEDVPGLAHFLEHMLFYSSEKYPEEDAYCKFIQEKGGKTNAYTSNESTNFHFDVNSDHLEEALDRFAQFFICPSISENGVLREAKAVDSEHSKNLNSDFWKQLQLWKTYSTGAMNRFSTGSYETLVEWQDGKSHERVLSFYETMYSANLMNLVVLGKQGLDELEEMCREAFRCVRNTSLIHHTPIFEISEDQRGIMIKHVPERDGHTLEIQWLVEVSEQREYRKSPLGTVSHILGHEENGTLFSVLKGCGFATSLAAGEAPTSTSFQSFMSVVIELTDEGLKHIDTVLGLVFATIKLVHDLFLNDSDKACTIWSEYAQLGMLRFEYAEKSDVFKYVSSLSHAMHVYKQEDLIQAMFHVPFEFDPDMVICVLSDLTPQNARIMLASKSVQPSCDLTEKWYGTAYTMEKIPQEDMQRWDRMWRDMVKKFKISIPGANKFLPVNLSMLEEEDMKIPILFSRGGFHTLYYRTDTSFSTPKAWLNLLFCLPESYVSPMSAVCTSIIVALVNDALSEISYSAELAGLRYSLQATAKGITLHLAGYYDKMRELAMIVIQQLLSIAHVPEDRFLFVKQKITKEYANWKYEQPYRLALYEMDIALEQKKWHIEEYKSTINSITCNDVLQSFLPRLFSYCEIQGLCEGNLPRQEYMKIVTEIEVSMVKSFGTNMPARSQDVLPRVIRVKKCSHEVYSVISTAKDNPNSAVVVSIQGVMPRSCVIFQLLTHIGKREAFYQLRTVEQLGYIVFFSTYVVQTVTHLLILIQSSEYNAAYLDSRALSFLSTLEKQISEMKQEEFTTAVSELIATKEEKPKRLGLKAALNWAEITTASYKFSRKEEEIEVLKNLSLEDFRLFVLNNVCQETRRMLRVHIQSSVKNDAEDSAPTNINGIIKLIPDIFQWKNHQALLPSVYDTL